MNFSLIKKFFDIPKITNFDSWKDSEKLEIQSKCYPLLEASHSALRSAQILVEDNQYADALMFLKKSAQTLFQAYQVIFPDIREPESLSTYVTSNSFTEKDFQWFRRVENLSPNADLHSVIVESAKIHGRWSYPLEHSLKQELATPQQIVERQQQKKIQRQRIILRGGLALIFTLIIVGLHWQFAPAKIYEETGQLFWKTETSDWAEVNSYPFPMIANGEFAVREYQLLKPAQMKQLRFDPVPGKVNWVEVRKIELYSPEEKLILKYEDFDSWKCIHCKLTKGSEGWRLKIKSIDPYIIGPEFPLETVNRFLIEYRVYEQLSFWEWITGGNYSRRNRK